MIELRWYNTDNKPRTLQYRQRIDVTVRAGMWSNEDTLKTANYQWTEWINVPEVYESPSYSGYPTSDKCPKCGLHLDGALGYACLQSNCPTGLGSSIS